MLKPTTKPKRKPKPTLEKRIAELERVVEMLAEPSPELPTNDLRWFKRRDTPPRLQKKWRKLLHRNGDVVNVEDEWRTIETVYEDGAT